MFYGFNSEYPYTDFHELNLNWIIQKMIEVDEELKNFVTLNTIKYADPIQWNITTQYPTNTVVIDPSDGTAYLSVQPVPQGVAITNTDYWTPVGSFGQMFDSVKESIAAADEGSSMIASANRNIGDLVWLSNTLYEVTQAIANGETYVINTNVEEITIEDILNALKDNINTIHSSILSIGGRVTDIENTINKTVLIDYDKYGITGDGDETDKFDLLLADLEDGTHYIFPQLTIHVTFGSVFREIWHNHIHISNLNVDGGDYTSSGSGFHFKGNNIMIENCVFTGINQCIYIGQANGIVIKNCVFDHCGYSIIQQRHTASNNGVIDGCTFTNQHHYAINLNCDTATSYNWSIINNIYDGAYNFPDQSWENGFAGITSVKRVLISNNIIKNSDGDAAIHIEHFCDNYIIADNVFHNWYGLAAIAGMVTQDGAKRHGMIMGNTFKLDNAITNDTRKFLQFNGSDNIVKVNNNYFYTAFSNEILSGAINNPMVGCTFDMPNSTIALSDSIECIYNIKQANDISLPAHVFVNNTVKTTQTPSLVRTVVSGVARPFQRAVVTGNIFNHGFKIPDAQYSVIKDNYIIGDGTADLSGVNIFPPNFSTLTPNYLNGLVIS